MVEGDDIDFEFVAGDHLGFDTLDPADAMGRIDDTVANDEFQNGLGHGLKSLRQCPVVRCEVLAVRTRSCPSARLSRGFGQIQTAD